MLMVFEAAAAIPRNLRTLDPVLLMVRLPLIVVFPNIGPAGTDCEGQFQVTL